MLEYKGMEVKDEIMERMKIHHLISKPSFDKY